MSRLLSVACSEDIIDNSVFVGDDGEMPAKDAIKIVGIRKNPDQPLGLTVSSTYLLLMDIRRQIICTKNTKIIIF